MNNSLMEGSVSRLERLVLVNAGFKTETVSDPPRWSSSTSRKRIPSANRVSDGFYALRAGMAMLIPTLCEIFVMNVSFFKVITTNQDFRERKKSRSAVTVLIYVKIRKTGVDCWSRR